MSKIVQAVNAIISNPDNITQVIQRERELFFLYKNKYKWSMSENLNQEYTLFYYPGDKNLDFLAQCEDYDWVSIDMLKYSTEEIGTKEAKASFAELYTLLKERLFGVHKVLDDIISDSELF